MRYPITDCDLYSVASLMVEQDPDGSLVLPPGGCMPLIGYLTDVLHRQIRLHTVKLAMCNVERQLIEMGVGDDGKDRVMRWEMPADDPP